MRAASADRSTQSTAALTVAALTAAVSSASGGKLKASIIGDADRSIEALAPLETAHPSDLSFLANIRYARAAQASAAGAIVLSPKDRDALFDAAPTDKTLIVCAEPYAWFAYAAQALHPAAAARAGIASDAQIQTGASVDAKAQVDAFAIIEAGAQIEAGAWIGAGCWVGANARIGQGTRLYPGVRVYAGCRIGARGIVHSGAVIGADGFGFAPHAGQWVKIPQVGAVAIGNDVEIGANTTIDRGTMGDTVIEDGAKIDNQVQIGHNCRIGAHSVIAGCTGIAGSTTIGRGCQVGGAVMISGHISIADGTVISGGTAVTRSINEPGFYSGPFPFMLNRDWERNAVTLRHLKELRDRVRQLEASAGKNGVTRPDKEDKTA